MRGRLKGLFPAAITGEYGFDPAKLGAYYEHNLEFLHPVEGHFQADADLLEIGASNRSLAFFEKAIERLRKDSGDALALRLLERYAPEGTERDPAKLQTTAIAPMDESERRLIEETGYVVRARQEGACAPGEAAFVLLEFLVEPGSTLRVHTVEPQRSPADPELERRMKGFERLPLSLPVESRDGEATLDRGFRAYQVFRTSPALDPGRHEIPYTLTAVPGRKDNWVEQRLSLPLLLSERR